MGLAWPSLFVRHCIAAGSSFSAGDFIRRRHGSECRVHAAEPGWPFERVSPLTLTLRLAFLPSRCPNPSSSSVVDKLRLPAITFLAIMISGGGAHLRGRISGSMALAVSQSLATCGGFVRFMKDGMRRTQTLRVSSLAISIFNAAGNF